MATTVTMTGLSGSRFTYSVYTFNADWSRVAGNYAFSYRNAQGLWVILYVGQADDFASRMPNHERWAEATRHGATHVLARSNAGGEAARLAEERDLIHAYDPPMNVHHQLGAA